MKKIIIVLLFSTAYAQHGFLSSTKVQVHQRFYKYIENLSAGSSITGYSQDTKPVPNFVINNKKQISTLVAKIYVKDTLITCGLSQQFYCYNKDAWLKAEHLSTNDYLLSTSGKKLKIKRLTILKQECELHTLHCMAPHTYAVTGYNILVHNNQEFISTMLNVLNNNQAVNITLPAGLQGALMLLSTQLIEYMGTQVFISNIPFLGWIAAAIASSYYLYYWATFHVLPAIKIWWCPVRKRFIRSSDCADVCCNLANETDSLIAHINNC